MGLKGKTGEAVNELQIFKKEEFGEIRTVTIKNEPWFVGKDVAMALGYERATKAIQDHVNEEDKDEIPIQDSIGRMQKTPIINESGLYALIFGSKLESAKRFKKWVTSEVLPSIRKNGGYISGQETMSDEELLAKALVVAQNKIAEKQKHIEELTKEVNVKNQVIGELKPKADYTDKILKNPGLVTITQIAKDYGMSAKEMNKELHDLGIQFKQSGQWLLYRQYHGLGYTHSETVNIVRADGRPDIKMNTKWTQKGRIFLYNKLKKVGIIPIIERSIKN